MRNALHWQLLHAMRFAAAAGEGRGIVVSHRTPPLRVCARRYVAELPESWHEFVVRAETSCAGVPCMVADPNFFSRMMQAPISIHWTALVG